MGVNGNNFRTVLKSEQKDGERNIFRTILKNDQKNEVERIFLKKQFKK